MLFWSGESRQNHDMNDPTTGHGETEAPPPDAAETGKPQNTLEAMRRQLVEHSALEDLGPLFGPEAQGKR